MKEDAEKLLMMLISDCYSGTYGKPSKATAIAMMKYVASDPELQRAVNSGDNKAIREYRAT